MNKPSNITKLCAAVRSASSRSTTASLIAAGVLASASVGTVPQALAQNEIMLEEVVVTARRREETLQDVPVAVTSLSENFLREQNIGSFEDLGVHVPSFRVSTASAGTNSPLVAVRGQRPVEVLLTLDPAVPLYFDEVVLTPMQGTNLAMYDLANVQVLKGPQGTLFGRNSTGGSVLLTSQKPGSEFGGYAEAKIGNYNLLQLQGAVDLPAGDMFSFRLAGRKVDRDGYQDNVADNALRCDECFWDEDSYGLRLSMAFTPSDNFNNMTVVSYDENELAPRINPLAAYNRTGGLPALYNSVFNGGLAGLNPFLPIFGLPTVPDQPRIDEALDRERSRNNWQEIETDVDGYEKVENTLFINTTQFDINDNLSVKNILGYRELDQQFVRDADGTAVPLFGAGLTSATSDVTLDVDGAFVDAEQWSNELQLIGTSFDDTLDWIVGAYWLEMEGDQFNENTTLGVNPEWPDADLNYIANVVDPVLGFPLSQIWGLALNGIYTLDDYSTTNEAYALFAEGNYHFNDQWTLTLGVRQTWDKREFTTRKTSVDRTLCEVFGEDGQRLPRDACSRTVSEDYSEPTWRVIASYTPSVDHMLYGSVSTGYKAGGFNARGNNNVTLAPYDPETVLNYELGYKGEWNLGGVAVRSNIALFYQDYDDIQKTQDQVLNNTLFTTIVNAAAAEISGGELELTVLPTDSLVLSLSYSYVDASYKEWDLPTIIGQNPDGSPIVDVYDNSNADFTYIPETSVTTQLNYTLPLDSDLGEVSFMVSGYWNSEMTADDEYPRWAGYGWTESDLENALETAKVKSNPVWNASIDWRYIMGSDLSASLWSTNFTDTANQLSGTSVPVQLGLITQSYGAPRTFGATLRYEF